MTKFLADVRVFHRRPVPSVNVARLARCCARGIVGGFVVFGSVTSAWALSSDREQPIHIEADRLDVDEAKGVSTYRGNVHYVQGTIRLDAATLTIHVDKDRKVERVEASGDPAKLQQRMDRDNALVRGQAKDIEYRVKDAYMLFTGGAHFWQCGNEFAGNRIEYFGQQEVVKAQRATGGEERVQVILQPQTQEATPAPCESEPSDQ